MLNIAGQMPILLWTAWAFIVGACIGSMLNVCIARLPLEKSILWPLGSRCMRCLQPVAWYDNIPLVSYWVLRGKCRRCGAGFSIRYFFIEFITACSFAGVFYLLAAVNLGDSGFVASHQWQIKNGQIPWQLWIWIIQRWTLTAFLIVVAACDIQSREIPLSVTITGSLVGLLFSTACPWPWPEGTGQVPVGVDNWWLLNLPQPLPSGVLLWPFWGPLPSGWLFTSLLTGFLTGLIGLMLGSILLRMVRFLATRGLGREALGLGDADLMMMVGAFLGWQAVVVAFFVGAMVALVLALIQLFIFRDDSLPFGPGLAIGSLVTAFSWNRLSPSLQPLLFNSELMLFVGGVGGLLLFMLCWLMGRFRGQPNSAE